MRKPTPFELVKQTFVESSVNHKEQVSYNSITIDQSTSARSVSGLKAQLMKNGKSKLAVFVVEQLVIRLSY